MRSFLAGFLRPRTPRSRTGFNEASTAEEGRNEAPTALEGGNEAPTVEKGSMALVVMSTDATLEEGRNESPTDAAAE